jgi:hypothetical protein
VAEPGTTGAPPLSDIVDTILDRLAAFPVTEPSTFEYAD